MKKVERQRVLSLSPLLSREGQEKSSFQVHTHTRARARAMVKCKKMRGSIVVARADRIYRCLLEGLRTTGRGKLPFAPAYEAPRSSFRFERIIPIEIYSDPTKFPLLGRDFLLSSKSIRAKHPSSSYPPRHTLRNFHPSLETSVRMNFAKALIYEQPCQRC